MIQNKRTAFGFLRLLDVIFIVLFVAMAFLRSQQNIISEDTVYHIKNGAYILQHGIPTADVYSFTAAGQTWKVHEWLWQVFLYKLYSAFGEKSIICVQSLIILSITGIMLFIGIKKAPLWLISSLLLAAALIDVYRNYIRPDVVSLLFFLITCILLYKGLNKRWSVAALFLIQVIWVNVHGFFIAGPLAVLVFWSVEFLKRKWTLPWEWSQSERLNDNELKRLTWIVPLSILACFLNPQFIKGAIYPLGVLSDAGNNTKHLYLYVSELASPHILSRFFDLKDWFAFKFLLVCSAVSFLINYRRLDLKLLILCLIIAFFCMRTIRTIFFFGPPAYLAIVLNYSQIRGHYSWTWPSWCRVIGAWIIHMIQIAMIILALSCLRSQIHRWQYPDFASRQVKSGYGHFSEHRAFAKKATDFLIANDIHGDFFNPLSQGMYLIYRTAPNIRVFFDGRVEIFSKQIYDDYLKIMNEGDWEVFQAQVKKYNITGVFISPAAEPVPPHQFLLNLYQSPEWKLVYLDYDGVIFLKNIPQYQGVIKKCALDLFRWRTEPMPEAFKKFIDARIMYNERALLLRELGYEKAAQSEEKEAAKIEPDKGRIHLLKSQIKKILSKDKNVST